MGRRRVRPVAACLAALLALVVAGCSASGGRAGGDRDGGGGRLRVVATTTQVADPAANVGGDRVQVTSLFKPNLDAHDYEPSPADIDTIARADLVVENGAGLEAWLGDTIDASGFDGRWSTPARASGCARSAATPTPTSGRTLTTPS